MGGRRSSSLSGSSDGSLNLPILSCILVLLQVYMYTVSVSGFNLTAVEKVYLVNTTIQINCSLNDSTHRTNSTDITWTFAGEVLNETGPQLVIKNAQFEYSGVYECKVGGHSQEEDNRWDVKVGLPPAKAVNIKCNCYDFSSVNCSWENGRATNIETTHALKIRNFDEINYCQRNQKCSIPNDSNNFFASVNSSNALAAAGVQSDEERFVTTDFWTITPIRFPSITNATSTSLQVSWHSPEECRDYPRGQKKGTYYTVSYRQKNTQQWIPERVEQKNCLSSEFIIHGLKTKSEYTIKITATVDPPIVTSKETILQGWTKEIAPEAGVNLELLCQRNNGFNEALLSWKSFPEDKSNGEILSYDITVNGNSSVITKNPNDTEHRLYGVDLYSDYNITIVARNSAGSSDVDECYIPASPRADPLTVEAVLIIVGAVLFIIVFLLAFKFYICFKKSKITEIKLPPHIQHDNFYLYGGPQRRAPCEQERYDELITQRLVETDTTLCNSTIPNGKKDPSREPIMPEPITTEVSTA